MAQTSLAKKDDRVEDLALSKVTEYIEKGMVLPEGYNPVNSLKKARFMLNDMELRGKPILEVCTKSSIIQCLVDSVTKGLDFSESQIYFIPRGNKMTVMESVYGRILRAKRASRFYRPIVQYVYEGDEFEFGPDVETGKTKIIKHTQKLENLDKKIIAAYTYVTDNNGDTNVFIMTQREWLTSWKKSSNGCAVAKEFEKDMIFRTIIKKSTKDLVRSNNNINILANSTVEDEDTPLAGSTAPEIEDQSDNYEEVKEEDEDPKEETPNGENDESDETDKPDETPVPGDDFNF